MVFDGHRGGAVEDSIGSRHMISVKRSLANGNKENEGGLDGFLYPVLEPVGCGYRRFGAGSTRSGRPCPQQDQEQREGSLDVAWSHKDFNVAPQRRWPKSGVLTEPSKEVT